MTEVKWGKVRGEVRWVKEVTVWSEWWWRWWWWWWGKDRWRAQRHLDSCAAASLAEPRQAPANTQTTLAKSSLSLRSKNRQWMLRINDEEGSVTWVSEVNDVEWVRRMMWREVLPRSELRRTKASTRAYKIDSCQIVIVLEKQKWHTAIINSIETKKSR